jgi:ABC-type nitrate/sulfonate/bicarbonate transport system permease component
LKTDRFQGLFAARISVRNFVRGSVVEAAGGLSLGMNRWLRRFILPVIEVIRSVPAPAVIPPFILFLGVDDALKISVISLACFFPVFTNSFAGVFAVDDTYMQTARTFRLTWLGTLRKVVFPATLPAIAAGLRTASSLALIAAVIVEMVAGSSSVGYFIVQMRYAMRADLMYAAVIYLAVVGYLFNRLFLILERSIIPWMGKT